MAQEPRSLTACTALRALAAAITGAVLLAGCPAPSPRPPAPGAPVVVPAPQPGSALPNPPIAPPASRPAPPARENHLSPATRSLVTQAHALLNHGDMDGAASTLDRALRIEPNNPLLWIERGRLRLVEGNARQAESSGRKALALASGDRSAQAQAGRLLSDALRAQQRNQAAAEVERQPFMR